MSSAGAKVMLITGASRGIGAATARLAARRGYDVAVNYVSNRAAAEAVVADIARTDARPSPFRPMSAIQRTSRACSAGRRCRARPPRRLLQQRRHRRKGRQVRRRSRPSACSAFSPSTRSAPFIAAQEAVRAHVDAARRQGRRDRQHVVDGGKAAAAATSRPTTPRPRAPSTASPSAWPRSWHVEGIRRQCGPAGPDRHRHPEGLRRWRPCRQVQAPRARCSAAARRGGG